ncbi:Transcription initiation factor TFIIF subunit beta [Fasciola gigantica]|uniref:General transcription factor IIF subunit 2 n=1 Tax=Fasciola gigantica TaxID=46835 RepID=A0A504Z225_FASGI|nr:Transcription initiation factor TFIIF subunit beta [Fasciola gigantica]
MSRIKAGVDYYAEAHALHSVDTSRAKDGVWLVKVPKYLAELWQKAGPDGVVGKVVIASSPASAPSGDGKRPASQVTLVTDSELLTSAGETGDLIPKEHQFLIQTSTNSSAAPPQRPGQPQPQSVQRRSGAMAGQELIILAEDDLALAATSTCTTTSSGASGVTGIGSASSSTTSNTTESSSPFSNSSSARYSRRLSLFGRVNSRAECRPPPNTRYMMLKAQQLKAMNRAKHEVRSTSGARQKLTNPVSNQY